MLALVGWPANVALPPWWTSRLPAVAEAACLVSTLATHVRERPHTSDAVTLVATRPSAARARHSRFSLPRRPHASSLLLAPRRHVARPRSVQHALQLYLAGSARSAARSPRTTTAPAAAAAAARAAACCQCSAAGSTSEPSNCPTENARRLQYWRCQCNAAGAVLRCRTSLQTSRPIA